MSYLHKVCAIFEGTSNFNLVTLAITCERETHAVSGFVRFAEKTVIG